MITIGPEFHFDTKLDKKLKLNNTRNNKGKFCRDEEAQGVPTVHSEREKTYAHYHPNNVFF